MVGSDAGDTGPQPDQDQITGILPDPYLLCSKTVGDSLLQRLEMRGGTAVCHDGETPHCRCASCSSLDANPASASPLGKGLVYLPAQM